VSKLYDFTQLDALSRCEVEFSYRYQQHLQRATPDASAHFGSAVHAGVRALFDGKPAGTYEDEKDALFAVSEAWADGCASEKKPYLTLQYAHEVVKMYAKIYGVGGREADALDRVTGTDSGVHTQPVTSSPFSLVLNEHYLEWPERSLCGIVDRVVRSRVDGQFYVMDLKTTGLYLSQAWFEQWRHSLQAAIYLDLVERALFDQSAEPVAGFWVDAIHVDRRGYPKPEDFMRVGPFGYSPALRSELRGVVDVLVRRAQDLDQAAYEPLKNPRNCYRYNSLCSFFQFCTLEPADRADAMAMSVASGELVQEEWVPALRR